jgi:hypothetical protein
MTKAASKTAGSGFTGASAKSLLAPLAPARFPVPVPFLREVDAVRDGAALLMFAFACSSAMLRSIAPRSLCRGSAHGRTRCRRYGEPGT